MNIAYLLKLIQALGTKLPQAWPLILHIAADIQELVSIFTDSAPPQFLATPESDQMVADIVAQGVPEAEARNVVKAFASAEAAGL